MDNSESHFREIPFKPHVVERMAATRMEPIDEELTIERIELPLVVKRATRELPEIERIVLEMHHGLGEIPEEMDYLQIAEILNRDVKEIEALDKRAKHRLRAMHFVGQIFGAYG